MPKKSDNSMGTSGEFEMQMMDYLSDLGACSALRVL